MRNRKGKEVRPVENISILKKRFARASSGGRKEVTLPAHPAIVISDLRSGSLASLGEYLASAPAEPDAGVLAELRKLLTGDLSESRYRLVLREHPDAPKDKGGRATDKSKAKFDRDHNIAAQYAGMIAEGDKRYIALGNLSGPDISKRTVGRIVSAMNIDAHTSSYIVSDAGSCALNWSRTSEEVQLSLEKLRQDSQKALSKLRASSVNSPEDAETSGG